MLRAEGSAVQTVARVTAGLVGGYAVCEGLAFGGARLLFASGSVTRPDAVLIATCLALFACPAVLVWAFATRRPLTAAAIGLVAAAGALGLGLAAA